MTPEQRLEDAKAAMVRAEILYKQTRMSAKRRRAAALSAYEAAIDKYKVAKKTIAGNS